MHRNNFAGFTIQIENVPDIAVTGRDGEDHRFTVTGIDLDLGPGQRQPAAVGVAVGEVVDIIAVRPLDLVGDGDGLGAEAVAVVEIEVGGGDRLVEIIAGVSAALWFQVRMMRISLAARTGESTRSWSVSSTFSPRTTALLLSIYPWWAAEM